MKQVHIQVSEKIEAPRSTIYGILSDYHQGHRVILPTRYFKSLKVEEGGTGAGTVARVEMSVMGSSSTLKLEVTEPEPGRVLVETDREAGITTTFTVDPVPNSRCTLVTISTVMALSPGFRGFVEKLLNPLITRRIYREELQLLAQVAAGMIEAD